MQTASDRSLDRNPMARIGGSLPFVLAGGLLVLALAAYAWATYGTYRRAGLIDAETALLSSSEKVLAGLTTIETSERGFILTGVDAFLDPYHAAAPEIEPSLASLRRDWLDTGADDGSLRRIEARARDELIYIRTAIDVRRQQGFEAAAAIVRSGRGKANMDSIRTEIGATQQRSRERIYAAEAADAASRRTATIAFTLAILTGLGLAVLALWRHREGRRTAGLLSRVLDNAPVGMAFVDARCRLQRTNARFAAALGGSQDAFVKQNVFDAYPDLAAKLRGPMNAIIANESGPIDTEIMLPDGSGGERVIAVSLFPLSLTKRGDRAIDHGAGLIANDETQARAAQRQVTESEARFRMIADTIPQMTWIADGSGRISWFNKRWFDYTGTTLERMQGLGWREVHHPDHVERVVADFQSALKSGEVWEDTFPLRGADGTFRWFLSQALPIKDDTGRVFRWFGTNTDVTRQRAIEEEIVAARDAAQEANVAKSQFLANMSHELRTPLSAVIGYTEMLEEDVQELGQEDLLADLGKIKSNARHLLSLINDVLDLSKIEADRMEVFVESFGVSETLADVAGTVGPLIEKKRNSLDIREVNQLGTMQSDQTKLRQCLINLLSNAAKFTENGTITLTAERIERDDRDWISLSVSDDGIGMSLEQTQKLFERFSQADASTTRRFGGTGLGLAITRSFCRLLGGDITVSSETGNGSCFTILVPAGLENARPGERIDDLAESQASPGLTGEAGLVLIVDDDQSSRDLMTRFMTQEGFAVQTAGDGVSGLQLARDLRPNIILLDVTMPRMDGWSVLTNLKADPDLARIPVVMVTVIDEHSLGYSLGASDYLLKPVEWDRLKSVVERLSNSGPVEVLAIDDDRDGLERTAAMLSKAGFRVETAANGHDGLEKAQARTPGLVLLDLMMPVMDGFAFLREFRANPEWQNIPVVVLTSKDITKGDWQALQGRADKVLSKGSVEMQDLVTQVRTTLAKPKDTSKPFPEVASNSRD